MWLGPRNVFAVKVRRYNESFNERKINIKTYCPRPHFCPSLRNSPRHSANAEVNAEANCLFTEAKTMMYLPRQNGMKFADCCPRTLVYKCVEKNWPIFDGLVTLVLIV